MKYAVIGTSWITQSFIDGAKIHGEMVPDAVYSRDEKRGGEFALKNGRPHDLVFTDCWMPKMSGGELVAKLRADPRFSHLPVYALTADSEFRSEQFTGILLKPLTFVRLVEVLATLPAGGA